jgi:hypothetical protein
MSWHKAKRGPAGTFVPAPDSEGRRDTNASPRRTLQNRLEHVVEAGRVDTSGRDGQPSLKRLRRTPIRLSEEGLGRASTFRPEVPVVLNEEGRRNRSRPLPRHRDPHGLDEVACAALSQPGSLWRADFPCTMDHADEPDGRVNVEAGTFVTFIGPRRTTALWNHRHHEKKDVVVRCTQLVFLAPGGRCVAWDFCALRPVVDDDDNDDD